MKKIFTILMLCYMILIGASIHAQQTERSYQKLISVVNDSDSDSDSVKLKTVSLIDKYKDFLVPQNIIYQTNDGSVIHYKINNNTMVAVINASASGNVYKSSSTATPLKTSDRLRIQNLSATGCTYGYRSWVKYDLSSIPKGSTVKDVDQYVYCISLNEGSIDKLNYDIYRVDNNPVSASGSSLWSDIFDGHMYETNEQVCNPNCWEWSDLNDLLGPSSADYDLQNSISVGWFAIGYMVKCNEDDANYSAEFRGFGETNPPYLAVEFTLPVYTLTVASLNPSIGVNINILPTDNNNKTNGATEFTRLYNYGIKAYLTAPTSVGGNNFKEWQKNGSFFSNNRDTSVKMIVNCKMTAVYLLPVPPAPSNFQAIKRSSTRIIDLTWSDNSNNEDGFKIVRRTPSSSITWQPIVSLPTNSTSYTDSTVPPNVDYIYYRIYSYNSAGNSNAISADPVTSVIDFFNNIPAEYFLAKNYPNPFNPSTNIKFGLVEESNVSLKIFDIAGQVVQTVIDQETLSAGTYKFNFVADQLPTGIYIYVINANSTVSNKTFRGVKKMILLK